MGKPKAPSAPDPQETATAQTGTNVATAIANANLGNVNQKTPYGSLDYSQSGSYSFKDPTSGKTFTVPQFTATQRLSTDQQRLLNINNDTEESLARTARSQASRLGGILGQPFTLSGLPAAGDASSITAPNYDQFGSGPDLQTSIAGAGDITKSYGTDYGANVQQVQDAMFSRVNPQIDRDRASLETSLVGQGIRRGSDAWNNATSQFDQGVNDQRTSILLSAGQEQSRLAGLARDQATFENSAQEQQYGQNANDATFGNGANQQMFSNRNSTTAANNALDDSTMNAQLARFNAQNTARSNATSEAFAARNQPINEIIGLTSGSQITNPSFVNTNMPSIPTTDYAGIVNQGYQNEMGAYNTQMSQYNGLLGGLFGLGASAIKYSDRRLKRDVRRIGTYRNGMPKYVFRYRDSDARYVGVMSDDVRKYRPDAVQTIDGFDAVNYRKALA